MAINPLDNYAGAPMKVSSSKSNGYDLSMEDFYKLMAAQYSNQNMYEPVDDSQYMAQMAQFSATQAMQQLQSAFMSSMAMNFSGQYVKVQATNANGKLVETEGYVERVNLNGGDAFVYVDGMWFKTTDIYEIMPKAPDKVDPGDKTDGDKDGDGTGSTSGTEGSGNTDGTSGTDNTDGTSGTDNTEGTPSTEGSGETNTDPDPDPDPDTTNP